MKTVLALLVLTAFTQAAKFRKSQNHLQPKSKTPISAPNFKKCNRRDPDADKCYLEAAQIGIHEATKYYSQIGLASLAPLEITELKIGAGSQGVVNVDQNFKNCKLYGIDDVKLSEFG